jgi:hypothetical protein
MSDVAAICSLAIGWGLVFTGRELFLRKASLWGIPTAGLGVWLIMSILS